MTLMVYKKYLLLRINAGVVYLMIDMHNYVNISMRYEIIHLFMT